MDDAGHVTIATAKAAGPAAMAEVERIFFEASHRTFAPGPDRDAFRERWLGRYLTDPGDVVLLALVPRQGQVPGQAVAGYLVGALDDPATQQRFADLPYFRGAFRALCAQYPAHLHLNVAAAFRNRGVGARLIRAFSERAVQAGAAGMHVVTGKGARNVSFYRRCGFQELGDAMWNENPVVFLGRALGAAA